MHFTGPAGPLFPRCDPPPLPYAVLVGEGYRSAGVFFSVLFLVVPLHCNIVTFCIWPCSTYEYERVQVNSWWQDSFARVPNVAPLLDARCYFRIVVRLQVGYG